MTLAKITRLTELNVRSLKRILNGSILSNCGDGRNKDEKLLERGTYPV